MEPTDLGLDARNLTRIAYEQSAASWMAAAGTVDRSTWANSYDMFASAVPSGGLVLDLGCAAGFDADGLASRGFRLVGLDIVNTLLRAANPKAPLAGRLVLADLMLLPFVPHSFEGVWASGSLHHLRKADLPAALAEARRVLKPEGALFVSVERGSEEGMAYPNPEVLAARYYAHYEPDELTSVLSQAEFNVVQSIASGATERSSGFIAAVAKLRH